MSILSEQSVASYGPQPSECDPLKDPMQLGPIALPTQSTSEIQPNGTASVPPAVSPLASSVEPLIEVNTEKGTDATLKDATLKDATLRSESASTEETAQQQVTLQRLCQNASLYSGDLKAAADLIVQSAVDLVDIDRASLWFYITEDYFQLISSYDKTHKTHKNGLILAITDHPTYLKTLTQRDYLLVEHSSQTDPLTQCLGAANLLLSGAFLEIPIRVQGKLVGFLWYEHARAHPWTAIEQTNAVSIALLAATAFDSQQRLSLTNSLTHHRRQLKRETIEREQAEQAWQESQRFIQGIIDASTNILYVDSFADGSNFYINRWIQNVLGYTPGDIQKLGKNYLEQLVHADEKALMVSERRKLLAINDGEVVENEYQFRHRQGNWRWLLCRETVFQRNEDGQPTQVFGTATDITKRKHAEVALQEFNAELERLARMDGLTQVANRRSFDEYLTQEWENVGSGRSALSLILCDIDYFKSFNDTYGHQAGDVCLRKVAKSIERAAKRNTDLVARYGGEEFAIVLPNTNEIGVQQVAQEIQQEIAALGILHSQSDVSEYITLSLGIASITSTKNAHPDMLVAAADQGLYQAKYDGRNRFCVGQIECA